MKKFLALVLALLMALSCVSFAGAEETKPGSETYNCEKDGHVYGEKGERVTEADCTHAATYEVECTKCGAKAIIASGDAKGHKIPADQKSADSYEKATCTTPGYYVYNKCEVCGESFKLEDTNEPATKHNWKDVEGQVVTPTCTEDGYRVQKCSNCDATQTVANGTKLGHLWSNSDDEKVKKYLEDNGAKVEREYHEDPTCLTYGYDGKAPYCVREGCTAVNEDESTLKQLPKLTHTEKDGDCYTNLINEFFKYDSKGNCIGAGTYVLEGEYTYDCCKPSYGTITCDYKAPTCEEDGYVTVTCECGWTMTEVIAKYNHTYVTGEEGNYKTHIVSLPAGARGPGANAIFAVSVKYVDKDGTVSSVFDLMPPVSRDEFNEDVPHYKNLYDCTLEMVAHYQCDICGKEWDGETFCFTEHKYAVYSVAQRNVKGNYSEDVVENEDGESDPKEVKMPSWLETCHDYDVTYKCVRCQQTKTETVAGTGHGLDKEYMEEKGEYKKGTCVVPGSDFYTCALCDTTLIVNRTETEPHTWGEKPTELVNNTCTTDGYRVWTCTVCGATKTDVIPATGHEEYLAKTEEATCEKTGLKTYKCARCGEVTRTVELAREHVIAKNADIKVKKNCHPDLYMSVKDNDDKTIGYKLRYTWNDCTQDGELQFICVHCNVQTITYTGKADHNWVKDHTTKGNPFYTFEDDNTCVMHYYEYYKCADCGACDTEDKMKRVEVTENVEHYLTGEPKVLKYAKCGVEGEQLRYCEHCEEWVKETIPAFNHVFETTWDAVNQKWTYTCADCGHVEDIVFNAPRFVIDASNINWANKTTGKGYVELEDNTMPFIQPRVYIRWTWVTNDGCDVVADKVVDVYTDDEGNHYFNAKGFAVSGATLSEMLIIVTDDENPDDMTISEINKLGYTVVKK